MQIAPLRPSLARAVLAAVAVAAVFVLLAALWFAADVLLVLFASVLLAILLTAMRSMLARSTGLREGTALAIVLVSLT
jgi:predicted PurR-regulated permease PerM